jgi:methionine-rich copper-binding protein CopC
MRRFLVFVLTVVLLSSAAGPAFAHAALISSDPPSGAIVTQPPSQITLTFNEELLESMVAVSVRDDQDTVLLTSVAEAAGTTVLFPWPVEASDGTYRLAYRVVSADGHPVTGEIEITVDATASAEIVSASLEAAQAPDGPPNWMLVLVIGLLVGIAVGLFAVALRRKRV